MKHARARTRTLDITVRCDPRKEAVMLHQKSIRMSRSARDLKHIPRVFTGNQAQVLTMGKARAGKTLREGL